MSFGFNTWGYCDGVERKTKWTDYMCESVMPDLDSTARTERVDELIDPKKYRRRLKRLGWVQLDGADYCPRCAKRLPATISSWRERKAHLATKQQPTAGGDD